MQFNFTNGSLSAALGVAGTGVALMFPGQTWIGAVLVALAVLIFLFDVRVDHGHVRAGSRMSIRQRIARLFRQPKADCYVEWALNHAAHHSVFSREDPDKWNAISLAFRQAAQRGDVDVWGQIRTEITPDRFSGNEVPIEQTYWDRAELNLMTFHLFPEGKTDPRDYERAKAKIRTTQQTKPIDSKNSIPVYGRLLTNRRQISKLGPLRREGSPLKCHP